MKTIQQIQTKCLGHAQRIQVNAIKQFIWSILCSQNDENVNCQILKYSNLFSYLAVLRTSIFEHSNTSWDLRIHFPLVLSKSLLSFPGYKIITSVSEKKACQKRRHIGNLLYTSCKVVSLGLTLSYIDTPLHT